MSTGRKVAVAIIVGLATATPLVGSGVSAIAVEKPAGLDVARTPPQAARSFDTQGPPVWEVVEKYVAGRKTVRIPENRAVKVVGARSARTE